MTNIYKKKPKNRGFPENGQGEKARKPENIKIRRQIFLEIYKMREAAERKAEAESGAERRVHTPEKG